MPHTEGRYDVNACQVLDIDGTVQRYPGWAEAQSWWNADPASFRVRPAGRLHPCRQTEFHPAPLNRRRVMELRPLSDCRIGNSLTTIRIFAENPWLTNQSAVTAQWLNYWSIRMTSESPRFERKQAG